MKMKIILATILMISLNVFAETTNSPSAGDVAVAEANALTATAPTDTKAAAADTKAAAAVTADSAATKSKETATLLKTKETEIPVHLDGEKKASTGDSPLFKVLMSLSVIGILGCGAFFWFRKYAKPGNGKSQATQIKVLTQHYLGPKKSLAIIRVAGESILVGVTDHNISLIKELSLLDEEIPETTPKTFKTVFSMGSANDNVDFAGENETTEQDLAERDEFSISGIKDFVSSKLKNMRSFE
jgi:flagellar protein FliO/FliZ